MGAALALLFASLLLGGGIARPAVAADQVPPPAAAVGPSLPIRVFLEQGRTMDAAYVGYASMGTIRIVEPNGRESYVAILHVLSVEDFDGKDYTRDVLEKRGEIGSLPGTQAGGLGRPGFRLRGRPLPECTSFAITEVGYLVPLNSVDAARGDREGSFVVDYGWMKNRSPSNALGVVAHLDAGSYRARFGPALRYRRWLSRRTAIDYEAGVSLLGSEDDRNFDFKAPGFFGQVNWQVEGILSITAQAGSRAVRYTGPSDLAPGLADQRGIDLRLGAKVGSGVGLGAVAGAATALIALILALSTFQATP
ncbi:MAG TPA: hypothetical protein VF363_12935 [Candidatus Eisenbacteria bacterium]